MKNQEAIFNRTGKGTMHVINGVQLYCEHNGYSGEPLVLVHGSWINHHTWDNVVPKLSESFQVLTYDRRGHSRSERPIAPGSIRQNVADLAALIENLELSPAHIVGNSYGASIALRLAEDRPDLFRSMIVNEPPLFSLLADGSIEHTAIFENVKGRMRAVAKLLELGDTEGGARQFVETIAFGPGMWEKLPSELKKTVLFNAPTFLDEMHDKEFFLIDLTRLQRFPHPVLLTSGEMSPPIFLPIVKKLYNVFPHAELTIFKGSGHEPEQTHPEDFVAAITKFITAIKTRP